MYKISYATHIILEQKEMHKFCWMVIAENDKALRSPVIVKDSLSFDGAIDLVGLTYTFSLTQNMIRTTVDL